MQEYNWIDMMNKMQELRLFCSLTVRGAKKEGLTSAQELDLLSRAVLSKVPLTPQEFSISMGLKKSAVSRLLRGLIEKKLLEKIPSEEDRRSYTIRVTEAGHEELRQTYQYYLGSIYRLRQEMGEENFRQLTELIRQGSEIMKKNGQ